MYLFNHIIWSNPFSYPYLINFKVGPMFALIFLFPHPFYHVFEVEVIVNIFLKFGLFGLDVAGHGDNTIYNLI